MGCAIRAFERVCIAAAVLMIGGMQATLRADAQLFIEKCGSCHGEDGRINMGTPAAPLIMRDRVQSGAVLRPGFEMTVRNGRPDRGMPCFGDNPRCSATLSAAELDRIFQFLLSASAPPPTSSAPPPASPPPRQRVFVDCQRVPGHVRARREIQLPNNYKTGCNTYMAKCSQCHGKDMLGAGGGQAPRVRLPSTGIPGVSGTPRTAAQRGGPILGAIRCSPHDCRYTLSRIHNRHPLRRVHAPSGMARGSSRDAIATKALGTFSRFIRPSGERLHQVYCQACHSGQGPSGAQPLFGRVTSVRSSFQKYMTCQIKRFGKRHACCTRGGRCAGRFHKPGYAATGNERYQPLDDLSRLHAYLCQNRQDCINHDKAAITGALRQRETERREAAQSASRARQEAEAAEIMRRYRASPLYAFFHMPTVRSYRGCHVLKNRPFRSLQTVEVTCRFKRPVSLWIDNSNRSFYQSMAQGKPWCAELSGRTGGIGTGHVAYICRKRQLKHKKGLLRCSALPPPRSDRPTFVKVERTRNKIRLTCHVVEFHPWDRYKRDEAWLKERGLIE